eukprot:52082-Eustigmatos_ZCMA.PRE.1
MAAHNSSLVRRVRVEEPGAPDHFFKAGSTYAATIRHITGATGIDPSRDTRHVIVTASSEAQLEEAEAIVHLLFTYFQWYVRNISRDD